MEVLVEVWYVRVCEELGFVDEDDFDFGVILC